MVFFGYFFYETFESIPSSARGKYLFLKKTFSFSMDSRDKELIVIGALAKRILENKPRKKRERKL